MLVGIRLCAAAAAVAMAVFVAVVVLMVMTVVLTALFSALNLLVMQMSESSWGSGAAAQLHGQLHAD